MTHYTDTHGSIDASRVRLIESFEIDYWTDRFGVSKERLETAVGKVGPMVFDVERELAKNQQDHEK